MNGTHPVKREEVMALQDGELAGKEWEAVAGHVAFCRECNAFLREMEQTSQELRSWRSGELSERVELAILAEAHAGTKRGKEKRGPIDGGAVRWTTRKKAMVGAAVAFGAMGLFAYIGSRPGWHEPRPEPRLLYEAALAQRQQAMLSSRLEVDKPAPAPAPGPGATAMRTVDQQGEGQGGVPVASEEIRQGPMIAQSVELAVMAKDVSAARKMVEAILAKHHGYAAELTVNTEQNGPRSLQASLKIPAKELMVALAELKALGAVQTETQKGEEVTQQHADLVARLKNSRETEKRLQAILQERTGKVSDVLAVEQEIARVRGDIEQMEAEQKAVEHRVDFATIELRLSEEYKEQLARGKASALQTLRNAAVTGVRNAYENLIGAVAFVVGAGPTLLLWVAILFLPARWAWKKRQQWMWGERKAAARA